MAEWNCFLCKEFQSGTACTFCDDGSEFRKMTNADRIRSMTDEELAKFLGNEKIRDEHSLCSDFGHGCYYYCQKDHACHDNMKQLYSEWLQSEAE